MSHNMSNVVISMADGYEEPSGVSSQRKNNI